MATEIKTKLENAKIVGVPVVQQTQTPINFMDALALLFIGLRLSGHLQDWTWIEVLSPLWAPLMLAWFLKLVIMTFSKEDGENQ